MVKGLPLAYNRDLQEDRQQLFDAVQTTIACTQITTGMWQTLTVFGDRYEDALKGDFLLATELADYLVTKGVAFRDAHHVVGRVVAHCESKGVNFSGVSVDELKTFHSAFDADVQGWLEPRAAAERRTSLGGTVHLNSQAGDCSVSGWENHERYRPFLRTHCGRRVSTTIVYWFYRVLRFRWHV